MKTIEAGSVDLILTDPPYGTTACKWDNVIPFEPMWEQIWRVLKPNGACILFGSEPFSSKLRMSQLKYFKYDWVWVKNRPSGTMNVKTMPMKAHEIVSVFYKRAPMYNPEMVRRTEIELKRFTYKSVFSKATEIDNRKYTKTPNRTDYIYKYPNNILFHKTVFNRSKEKTPHPTQKPVALLEYLIRTYTIEGETVLDFTMGSGSTGVACVNTGRKFIGIELDEKYFEIARERIARQHDCLACKQETLW
jgi:site-specific DNA-methyltransferase (adenine-specific)